MTYLEELKPRRRYDRFDFLAALKALLPRGVIWRIPLPDEQDIAPVGIPSEEAFGRITITQGELLITANGIESGEAFGVPVVSIGAEVLASGIPTGESWGSPTITTS